MAVIKSNEGSELLKELWKSIKYFSTTLWKVIKYYATVVGKFIDRMVKTYPWIIILALITLFTTYIIMDIAANRQTKTELQNKVTEYNNLIDSINGKK